MAVHAAQCGGCGWVLRIEALKDPVLEDGIHGHGDNRHEDVDRRVLKSTSVSLLEFLNPPSYSGAWKDIYVSVYIASHIS